MSHEDDRTITPRKTAWRLGLLARHVASAKRLSRAEMDEIVMGLREGEKCILALVADVARTAEGKNE